MSKGTEVSVRRKAGWVALVSALLLLATAASAQEIPRPRERAIERGGPQQMLPAQGSGEAAQSAEPERQGRSLSPEERRQLRRDVHEAGRDIYPDRMRQGRREMRRQ
jgi:hypothetical protein